MSSSLAPPAFSKRAYERFGTFLGLGCIPSVGLVTLGGLWIISLSDDVMASSMQMLTVIVIGATLPLSVIAWIGVFSAIRKRNLEAFFLDEVAASVERGELVKSAVDFPRVWCRVGGHMFEVLQHSAGRNVVSMGEVEDDMRRLIFEAVDAPQSRIPRGRHARVTVTGDVRAGFRLFVASAGSLSMIGAKIAGLQQVFSGSSWFDQRVVVFTDDAERAAAILSRSERRDVLVELLNANGVYVHHVLWAPASSPREPGVTQRFALHERQTGQEQVAALERLVEVASWTRR